VTRWDSAENAAAYARFCREFPMYRETSAVLASLANLETAQLAVDLACGTGATTGAILARLPATGSVVAVDASAAMLDVARTEVADPRVRWVRARAEELAEHVDSGADVVLCNSAFWQTDMPAAAEAVRRVLRPGGRFVFNIGEHFIRMPDSEDRERERSTPSLTELMWAAAVLYHGFVPRLVGAPPGTRGPRTIASVNALLVAAGLEVEPTRIVEQVNGPESLRAWLSVPIFTERQFPGLSYEQRMDALDIAYERLDEPPPDRSRWAVFVARTPG
jgi:SAM-dependent methyltransferase